MEELISVIIPVYNVEPYLRECIDSVIGQTYSNLEIILVDDGSQDNSGVICDEYARLDDRIHVIHKRNGGLSDARNKGFDVSSGEYVLFIDSDDYIETTMVEQLYKVAKQDSADMAICYFDKVYDKEKKKALSNENYMKSVLTGKEMISLIYKGEGEQTSFTAWNKLYKRSLFEDNNIIYPVGRYHEDTFTTYKLLYFSVKVAVVNSELYHYRIRDNSITTTSLSKKRCRDILDANYETLEFYEDKFENELFDMAFYNFCKTVMKLDAIVRETKIKAEKKEMLQLLKCEYSIAWKRWKRKTNMSIKRKAITFLYLILPFFCYAIVRKHL